MFFPLDLPVLSQPNTSSIKNQNAATHFKAFDILHPDDSFYPLANEVRRPFITPVCPASVLLPLYAQELEGSGAMVGGKGQMNKHPVPLSHRDLQPVIGQECSSGKPV